jgi:hypothetical protein
MTKMTNACVLPISLIYTFFPPLLDRASGKICSSSSPTRLLFTPQQCPPPPTAKGQTGYPRTGGGHGYVVVLCVLLCILCAVCCLPQRHRLATPGRVGDMGTWCVVCTVYCVVCGVWYCMLIQVFLSFLSFFFLSFFLRYLVV